MDAFRRQASKLREQVAKQQQAVIKQFSGTGYESSDVVVIDEIEMQRHLQLDKLYKSTRLARDFQKDVIKVAEAFTAIGYKYIETDARHLAQRYSRMRQEAEALAAEISRRQARIREAPIPENVAKLHATEAKMQEIKANMAVLGKEAAAALAAVEAQQQRLTLQRLVAMVEGEKTYHLRVAAILNEIEAEMVSEKQRKESAPPVIVPENGTDKTMYYLAEAMHPFFASSEKELSLSVGDFVVVRKSQNTIQVSPTGWSEGECKGKAGWFPSSYVEKRQRLPSSNLAGEAY
ncbi:hypothetical protein V6N11_005403 [Hibiscus sabdariffa]|uniref:Uncharacterized protein n=2 Tax=Hibiscus sabdariffa TaxID=183260 RepID=A0ABR2AIB0_9ROSI